MIDISLRHKPPEFTFINFPVFLLCIFHFQTDMKMEGTKFLKRCSFLLAILSMLKLNGVVARVYTVGDEEEWSSQANFDSWANRYNFSVGDVLVFKYVKGEHNVYEVREDTYRSCDTSGGVLGKYESGEDEVELSESKKYWFICNVAGHCLGGMRFGIRVLKQSNAASASSPQIQPPPSHNSCANIYATHYLLCFFRIIIVQFVIIFYQNFGYVEFINC